MKALADIGFEGVEFAGRYGPYKDDPAGLKRLLAQLGLDVIGVHAGIPSLHGAQGKQNFSFYAAIGAKNVIIPHDARVNDSRQIDALIQELNQLEKVARTYGLQLGYHNHAKEFDAFQSSNFWQYLAANTSPQFIMQLDVGWANFAGKDPLLLIKNVHPNRVITSHLKIRSYQGKPNTVAANAKVIIGEDNYDWDRLVKTTHQYGGTKWLIVEQEEYPLGKTPLEAVAASFHGLVKVSPYLMDARNKRPPTVSASQ